MSNIDTDPNALLTLRDAVAAGYGGHSTLRMHIASGRLPAVKIGGRVRIRRGDLDAFATPVRAGSTEAAIQAAVQALVAAAPPLRPEQLDEVASAFADAAVRGLRDREVRVA